MPFYCRFYECPAASEISRSLTVEGQEITDIGVAFPPGPCGLLKVGLFYGEKKIYPSLEEEWISGDNIAIWVHDPWTLPESPCRIIVKAINEDTTYEHRFHVYIRTSPVKPKVTVKFRVTPEGFIEVVV